MKKIVSVFLVFLSSLSFSMAQNSIISGQEIEIENEIKQLLGEGFDLNVISPNIDIGALTTEVIEAQIKKGLASASVTSVTAATIMDEFMKMKNKELGRKVADVRNEFNQGFNELANQQANLIKLKMQSKLGLKNMPHLNKESFSSKIRVSELMRATAAEQTINKILNKEGVGTSLSVYERLKLGKILDENLKNKSINENAKRAFQRADQAAQNAVKSRINRQKALLGEKIIK